MIELLISLGMASLLLTGMASAMYVASRAARPSETLVAVQQASAAIYDLTDELQHAIYLTERSETIIEFVLADTNGDGEPDVLRYEWSGTPGDPLTRTVNGGEVEVVADDVQEWELEYAIRDKQEQFEDVLVESSVRTLSESTGGWFSSVCDLQADYWPGQYFTPSLPTGTRYWKPSSVSLQLRRAGSATGQFKIQLRPATGDGSPTSEVLQEVVVNETSLKTSDTWETYSFDGIGRLSPSQNLCLVVSHVSGSPSGQLRYEHYFSPPSGRVRLESRNQGGWWTKDAYEGLRHRVRGTCFTPSGSRYAVTRRYATGVRVTLRTAPSEDSRIHSQIPLLNTPELLAGHWKLDFDTDPRSVDANHDGAGDWAVTPNSNPFDPASLVGGVWQAQAADAVVLGAQPDSELTQLTTVEVRCRSTSYHADGRGATLQIRADRSGSTSAVVFTSVRKELDGSQTARVYMKNDATAETLLAEQAGLGDDFVELRLVIDPSADRVAVWINGVYRATEVYARFGNDAGPCLTVQPSQSDAEFDYVSMRVSDNG